MGGKADTTRHARMIKIIKISTRRKRNTSSREIVNNLAKDVNKISRTFTTVNTKLKNLKEADYNLYDSEDEDEASNF